MSLRSLRLSVFACWVFGWLVSIATFLCARWIRGDDDLTDFAMEGLLSTAALYIPPLSCMAGFWLGKPGGPARRSRGRKGAVAVALSLTALHLLLLEVLIYGQVVAAHYPESLEAGQSFAERVSLVARWNAAVSVFMLMPVVWLTGRLPEKPRAKGSD